MTYRPDRREVVRLGVSAAVAAMTPVWPRLALASVPAPTFVLADPRYRDSAAFARGATLQGATAVPLMRNLAEIWRDVAKPRLPGPLVMTGLTLDSDLFILSRLAEGSGVKTAYSGSHDWRWLPGSVHRLSGTVPLDWLAGRLKAGGKDWARRLGSDIARMGWDGNSGGARSETLTLQLARPADPNGPRYLVSWLLCWPRLSPKTS